MSAISEVNIPKYLDSLGFKPSEEFDEDKNGLVQVYYVPITDDNCMLAADNLPWSFSLTKIYQLFLLAVGHFCWNAGIESGFLWARDKMILVGRNELQSFFNAHKANLKQVTWGFGSISGFSYTGKSEG